VTNKVEIGFDMDGVFLPDHSIVPDINQKEFFELTLYEKPIFNPTYTFDIVTARVEAIRPITEKWLAQLKKQPKNIFMRPDESETPAEFKYRIAVEQQYKIYVESDLQICKDMLKLIVKNDVDLRVIHFDSWIQQTFIRSFFEIDDWK
jgi:uncharacterized HAD superfamily protein